MCKAALAPLAMTMSLSGFCNTSNVDHRKYQWYRNAMPQHHFLSLAGLLCLSFVRMAARQNSVGPPPTIPIARSSVLPGCNDVLHQKIGMNIDKICIWIRLAFPICSGAKTLALGHWLGEPHSMELGPRVCDQSHYFECMALLKCPVRTTATFVRIHF